MDLIGYGGRMDWLLLALFLAACLAAGSSGAMFSPGKWYRGLRKPRWTPPNWVFPVVWYSLYICIAVAAARVAPHSGSGYAMAFFAIQIALNTLWTPVFFGLKRIGTAMAVLTGLWLSVAGMLGSFWMLDRLAGILLLPYLTWVTLAGTLNFSVWRKNPVQARNT